MRKIYFSPYVDESNITTVPRNTDDSDFRYKIDIPFVGRDGGPTAVVIMKNPSKAGKYLGSRRISDDTIYRVCDYVYKLPNKFSKLVILNLMGRYGSDLKKITFESLEELIDHPDELGMNIDTVTTTVHGLDPERDIVIVAWGKPNDLNKQKDEYNKLILRTLFSLRNIPLWRVGPLKIHRRTKYPLHGLAWYDYHKLKKYHWRFPVAGHRKFTFSQRYYNI